MSNKLTYGVGYNSTGVHKTRVNDKITSAYYSWSNMMQRCYSVKFQKKKPTYIGCTVADEWHDFQCFAEWFYSQEDSDKSYALDKDLLFPNNKTYSPDTCVFIPQELNKLLCDRKAARGKLPQGVTFHIAGNKYMATISINAKTEYLGSYHTPDEAYKAYRLAKEDYVKKKAIEWRHEIDERVFQALMNWQLTE